MSTLKIVSSVVLALGIVILVVLVVLGAVVRQTIKDTITDRLIYELPEGAKKDINYEACYRDTEATFENEYYMWNLTNEDAFLAGAKPAFNLVGPFSYVQWYCRYNYELNEKTGYLSYRTRYEGYFFLRNYSILDDSVKITNINPAYLGVLKQTSDANLPLVFIPLALNAIIRTLQLPSTLAAVQQDAFAGFFTTMNANITLQLQSANAATLVTQFPRADFFDTDTSVVDGVQGWASYVHDTNATANYTIEDSVQQQIYADLTNAVTFETLLSKSAGALATDYNLSNENGEYLADYIAYLFGSTPVENGVTSSLYNQWANGTTSNAPYPTGWGLGVASGISYNDAVALFDTNAACSLTSNAGIQVWYRVQGGASLSDLCPGTFTLSADQVQTITAWLTSYTNNVLSPGLLIKYKLATWDDFAYAQWGNRVAGKSVQDMATFNPTTLINTLSAITAIDPQALSAALVDTNNRLKFTPESNALPWTVPMAKDVLNGTHGLFNTNNMLAFLTILSANPADPRIAALYGSDFANNVAAFWALLYINYNMAPNVGLPMLQIIFRAGGGYVTTRTVREWLFTGLDPLLPFLGQSNSVGTVGNLTRTKAEADLLNKTYVPVYTGKNDLLWSLMPYNNGTNLTFWNGTVQITGYNGTQFLPNYYIDKTEKEKEYPLLLFHRSINRTIPFTNKAKLTWKGVNVRYLGVSDDALLSADKNPDNYKYYSEYSGVINKTSNPPGLPIFLSTPNFLSAEPAFSANVTWTDTIWTDYKPEPLSQHRLTQFILVEPLLGSTLWGNLPIQVNLGYKPSALYPHLNGGFAPLYWNAIGDKASDDNLATIRNSLYAGQRTWKVLIGIGAGVGSVMIVAGIVGLVYYRKQKGIKL